MAIQASSPQEYSQRGRSVCAATDEVMRRIRVAKIIRRGNRYILEYSWITPKKCDLPQDGGWRAHISESAACSRRGVLWQPPMRIVLQFISDEGGSPLGLNQSATVSG